MLVISMRVSKFAPDEKQRRDIKGGEHMAKFEDRFGIEVPIEKARKLFVNRVHYRILEDVGGGDVEYEEVALHSGERVCDDLGLPRPLPDIVGDDFHRNLKAIEALYGATSRKAKLDKRVRAILGLSEIDLGVRWEDGEFKRAGSRTLDKKLVRDVLGWARDQGYETVTAPFEKGLRRLLESTNRPELRIDVVRDTYEALEAVAKVVTGKEGNLNRSQQQFTKAIHAPDVYERILKEYIAYADKFRHAAPVAGPKPTLSAEEVESFVYLTGIFIRFAMRASGAL